MSSECLIVEAAVNVHSKLEEMAKIAALSKGEEVIIQNFIIGCNSARWDANCQKCLGDVTVHHTFLDSELGQNVQVKLPDVCPQKPNTEDSPTLYYEMIPPEL